MLEKVLSELYGAKNEEIKMTACTVGDVNTSYIAQCGERKYFVKTMRSAALPKLYENQLEREVTGTSLCGAKGIPCPAIAAYDFDEGFIISEFMSYPLLGQIWGRLDDGQKKYVKSQALGIIERMNGISSDYFGSCCENGKIKRLRSWCDSFSDIVNTALEDCVNCKSLDSGECGIILNKVENICGRLENDRKPKSVFAHLDFHWNNIFIDEESLEIKGVFDFGSSLFVPDYMPYFRLDGGFLYGTERFYDSETVNPCMMSEAKYECADLLNTMDYFTFLSFKGRDGSYEKQKLLSENFFQKALDSDVT